MEISEISKFDGRVLHISFDFKSLWRLIKLKGLVLKVKLVHFYRQAGRQTHVYIYTDRNKDTHRETERQTDRYSEDSKPKRLRSFDLEG